MRVGITVFKGKSQSMDYAEQSFCSYTARDDADEGAVVKLSSIVSAGIFYLICQKFFMSVHRVIHYL